MNRRLHGKDLSGPCYVYLLVNPWTKMPFYVGISVNPWSRFHAHRHDRSSSAWPMLRDFYESGASSKEILQIYERCPDRNTAWDLEHWLITCTPGLLNRDTRRYRLFEETAA